MKTKKPYKAYLLDFLMNSSSLHDLLGILANICENLNLDYLNPRIKHFKYFQFTFFGLMVKAKGLLEMMAFRSEFLKGIFNEFNGIHSKLINLNNRIKLAYNLINKNRMIDGKNKIIELNKEYSSIFENITKLSKSKL